VPKVRAASVAEPSVKAASADKPKLRGTDTVAKPAKTAASAKIRVSWQMQAFLQSN
jgi:hypothetical protein